MYMKLDNSCLLCKSETIISLALGLCRCQVCGFLFLSRAERKRQQESFLPMMNQTIDQASLEKLRQKYPKDRHDKRVLYQQYGKQVVAWYGKTVRVLDVGANGGFFLHAVEEQGAVPSALRTLEISPTYQALTKEYFGYEGAIANIEDYKPQQTFDVISLFDVLEHVNEFWVALSNMREMLSQDGRIILKLPNGRFAYLKYQVAKALGWSHKIPKYLYLEPGGHLNYWDYKTIKKLELAGFVLESFVYVAPTREQFGKQYPLRAIAYKLNQWLGLNLFPEFIAVLRKQ